MSIPFDNTREEPVVEVHEDGTFVLREKRNTKDFPDVYGRECTSSLSQPEQKADKPKLPWGFHPDEKKKRNRPGFADRN